MTTRRGRRQRGLERRGFVSGATQPQLVMFSRGHDADPRPGTLTPAPPLPLPCRPLPRLAMSSFPKGQSLPSPPPTPPSLPSPRHTHIHPHPAHSPPYSLPLLPSLPRPLHPPEARKNTKLFFYFGRTRHLRIPSLCRPESVQYAERYYFWELNGVFRERSSGQRVM